MKQQTWQSWIRACAKDSSSPNKLPPGMLGAVTGQDARALDAISGAWSLYATGDETGQRAALSAVTALLAAVQPQCRAIAKELIAFHMNWEDRDRLWIKVYRSP